MKLGCLRKSGELIIKSALSFTEKAGHWAFPPHKFLWFWKLPPERAAFVITAPPTLNLRSAPVVQLLFPWTIKLPPAL